MLVLLSVTVLFSVVRNIFSVVFISLVVSTSDWPERLVSKMSDLPYCELSGMLSTEILLIHLANVA